MVLGQECSSELKAQSEDEALQNLERATVWPVAKQELRPEAACRSRLERQRSRPGSRLIGRPGFGQI